MKHGINVNGETVFMTTKEAIKYYCTQRPASECYFNLLLLFNSCPSYEYKDKALLTLWIDKCEKRAKELGIEL